MNENMDVNVSGAVSGEGESARLTSPPQVKPTAPDDWREMMTGKLAELCRAEKLPASGRRADLLKRLDAHFHGSSTSTANGRVVCPHCKAVARCNGTRRMSETIRRRSYRCSGRRRHGFTLDSEEKSSQ